MARSVAGRCGPEGAAQLWGVEEASDLYREGPLISHGEEETRLAVLDLLENAPRGRRYDRATGTHPLRHHATEWLGLGACVHDDVESRKRGGNVSLVLNDSNLLAQAQLTDAATQLVDGSLASGGRI